MESENTMKTLGGGPGSIFGCPTPLYTAGEDVLNVLDVDMCFDENANNHHTNRFVSSNEYLIVRRGDPFRMILTLNRPYDSNNDAISFMFTVFDDKKPSPGLGTLIGITPSEDIGDTNDWSVIIDDVNENTMSVLIKPAVTCPVTQWKLIIDTKLYEGSSRSFCLQNPIYILFNPWSRDDQVFLDNEDEREEYILNDTTLIWRGCYNQMQPSIWKIGQFEPCILECSTRLIATVGSVSPSNRGDPVRIARALSAAINSNDDSGVMMGNWSQNFSSGTAPTMWTGSVGILQEFNRTQKPVKYGQCWNFAGILTTVARALGIPSRIVTNFLSAHDTQGSLTVDIFIDQSNRTAEMGDGASTDSIWNYHVWSEMWMERPDLGVGPNGSYGGWQAVDATPQESSDKLYQCGPASVAAIKQGEILRPYDCGFLYAEVNADRLYWRYNGPLKPMKLISRDTHSVGRFISTKAVGRWDREDITHTYKFEEKTEKERNTMIKALKQSGRAFCRYYLNEGFDDVEFEVQPNDNIKIGENFTIVVKVTNKSKENEHVATGHLRAETVFHNGKNRTDVKSIDFGVELKPDSSEYVKMEVNFDEYYAKLHHGCDFKISCSGQVKGKEWEHFSQDDFRLCKPDIKIKLQGEVIAKEAVNVIVRLTNPLPFPLKGGVFTIVVPGMYELLRFKIAEIPVGGTGASTFKFIPPAIAKGVLIAKFHSKELCDVDGYLDFEVEPRSL